MGRLCASRQGERKAIKHAEAPTLGNPRRGRGHEDWGRGSASCARQPGHSVLAGRCWRRRRGRWRWSCRMYPRVFGVLREFSHDGVSCSEGAAMITPDYPYSIPAAALQDIHNLAYDCHLSVRPVQAFLGISHSGAVHTPCLTRFCQGGAWRYSGWQQVSRILRSALPVIDTEGTPARR